MSSESLSVFSDRHVSLCAVIGLVLITAQLCGCGSSKDLVETGARITKGSDGNANIVTLLNTETTDAELSQLADHSTLTKLKIQECDAITGSGLQVVEQLSKLEHIELVQTPITNEGVMHLQKVGTLKYVLLSDIAINDEGLTFLSGCPEVDHLRLEVLKITDAGLEHLSPLSKLTKLSLEDCPSVTGSGFTQLAALPGLEEINLKLTGVLPDHADNLASLTNVQQIVLDTDKVTDDVLAVLGTMSNIEILRLYSAPVTNAGLAHLRGLPGLQLLELASCQEITNEGLKALEGHPSLTDLDLSAVRGIDDSCVSILATIKSLKKVQVQDTPFSGSAAKELKELLPECTITYGGSPNTNQL